ncbi:MAG TPA: hypothetical protein VFE12_08415 [Acetobacteraceae bacterium]|nr:hypothetical protein [Acetobacteraceae bacterium]
MSDPAARLQAGLIIDALDAIVQACIDAGVQATRIDGDFQPPGAIVSAPTITGAATMQTLAMTVPVYVVTDQPGSDGLEWSLEAVSALLPALGVAGPVTPTTWISPINPAGLPAYLLTVQCNVTTS